jgi:Domain of unknown function (DUF4440)
VNKIVLLLAGVLLLSFNAAAQKKKQKETQAAEVERQTSDARSFVELFTKLEMQWMEAVQKKDREALDAMLAPEFLVRSSVDPEHSVSRTDWMRDVLTNSEIRSYSFSAMTIRAFLGVAIVGFVESEQATTRAKEFDGERLIVDVWQANHGKWQPVMRFSAPVQR